MKSLREFRRALIITVAAAGLTFGQAANRRVVYQVANFTHCDTSQAEDYADRLTQKIEHLNFPPKRCKRGDKDWWACCKPMLKPTDCEVVSIQGEVLPSGEKTVHIRIYNHQKNSESPVELHASRALTCSASTELHKCYEILLDDIARTVVHHDEDCHRGKACKLN